MVLKRYCNEIKILKLKPPPTTPPPNIPTLRDIFNRYL